MATKSRSRRASRSVVDGATSLVSIIPGLAAKGVSIVEAVIGLLDKIVGGALTLAEVAKAKLEEFEAFLREYAKE